MKQETEGEEKRMEAKAYLEQARNINIQIDSKLEQVSSLRQLAIKASSTLSPVPPSGTPNPHRLEETIARMMDMEQEVDEAIDVLVELKADIMKLSAECQMPGNGSSWNSATWPLKTGHPLPILSDFISARCTGCMTKP